MDDLFQQPLWTMWRHAYPSEAEKVWHGVKETMEIEKLRNWVKKRPSATLKLHLDSLYFHYIQLMLTKLPKIFDLYLTITCMALSYSIIREEIVM